LKRNYWSKELCKKEALKYTTRGAFSEKSRSCYSITAKRGWLDYVCAHMTRLVKPNGYWVYETCKEEALKYTNKTDFYNNCRTGYEYARKNRWLYTICYHFEHTGNLYRRLVYVYIFSDNTVYIGLTYNFKNRNKDHFRYPKSPIYKHIQKTGLTPKCILSDYIPYKDAQKLEGEYIEKYKKKRFYCIK
jgi:hypothetical protein